MKKLIIILFLILTGCTNEINGEYSYETIPDIETVFSSYNEDQYYINCNLLTSSKTLLAKQKIIYFPDKSSDELYLNVYGNDLVEGEPLLSINSLRVNDKDVEWNWTDEDYSNVFIKYPLKKGTQLVVDLEYKLKFTEDGETFYIKKVDYKEPDFFDRLLNRIRYKRRIMNGTEWDFKATNFYPVIPKNDVDGWNLDVSNIENFHMKANYYVNINAPYKYEVVSPSAYEHTYSKSKPKNYFELLNSRDFSFSASKYYQRESELLYESRYNYKVSTYLYSPNLNIVEAGRILRLLDKGFMFSEDAIGTYNRDSIVYEFGNSETFDRTGIIYLQQKDLDNNELIINKLIFQWFYDVIKIDKNNDPWLVDGLTTFLTGEFFETNTELLDYGYYSKYNTNQESKKPYLDRYGGLSVLQSVDEFSSEKEYDILVKYYGSSVLKFYLDEILNGNNKILYKALNKFYNKYHSDTPSLDDFLTILEEETGVENTKKWFVKYLSEFQVIKNDI